MLNENFFVTLMKSEEVKKIGNCRCLVRSFSLSLLSLHATMHAMLSQKCLSSDAGKLSLNSFICLAIS